MRKKPTKIRLDADLLDSLRDAAAFLGRGITVTGIVEDAITKEVQRLEKEHGGPFPEGTTPPLRESGKEPLVIRMPEDVVKRLRNAASFHEDTMASLANAGVERELKEMEKRFHNGKKFPKRDKDESPETK